MRLIQAWFVKAYQKLFEKFEIWGNECFFEHSEDFVMKLKLKVT